MASFSISLAVSSDFCFSSGSNAFNSICIESTTWFVCRINLKNLRKKLIHFFFEKRMIADLTNKVISIFSNKLIIFYRFFFTDN
ncbi:hypothetical protein BpHYR1_022984 [Brachionus plicatilis]|uniref:Uncharacterized protein n=1 Tax=Brachionus plicatilis TaxID=10195 RepID=A0A3M7SLI0_BRAPC|nr:hypothetical protein BpHYR1_022984 [Brachionus plicatilis]